jgi:hypothetical protein
MRRRNRNQSRSSLFQTLSLLLLSCLAFFTSGQIITNHDQEGMMEPSVPGIVKQKYNNNNNNNNQEQYDSSAAAAAAATIVSQKADTMFNLLDINHDHKLTLTDFIALDIDRNEKITPDEFRGALRGGISDTGRQQSGGGGRTQGAGSFFKGFTSSTAMIIATEIGDKTFFIAAVLSMRHSRINVFAGAILALVCMTILR